MRLLYMRGKAKHTNYFLKVFKKVSVRNLRVLRSRNRIWAPDLIVTLSYSQFFNDFKTVDPRKFLKGIPSFRSLAYVLTLESKVHYTFHSPEDDKELVDILYGLCSNEEKLIIDKARKRHKYLNLINNEGTLRFVRLAMSCFTKEDGRDSLTKDEEKKVLIAYLYCNQLWTNEQLNVTMFQHRNLVDVSLKLDLPFSEFKYFKDFRTQLYKSIKFFEFVDNDGDVFSQILTLFCKERKVANWKDYIRILFTFFQPTLNSPLIDMSDAPEQVIDFMTPYLTKDAELPWKCNLKGPFPLGYRDKFLLQSTTNPNYILVLSSDLLVDKFYQGLKFDFGDIAQNYDIKNTDGDAVGQSQINALLGKDFSEDNILYPIIELIYNNHEGVILKPGSTTEKIFRKQGGSEPDYYWRKDDKLILFENKDVLFPDSLKTFTPLLLQKQSITNKLATFAKSKVKGKFKTSKEGLGQIYYNLYRMLYKPELYRSFDLGFDSIKTIYPVLVVYDRTYSALGVNAFLTKKVSQIKKRLSSDFKKLYHKQKLLSKYDVKDPIVINIDTLIMYSLVLKNKNLDLIDLLNEYLDLSSDHNINLSSFDTFIVDHHRLGPQGEEFINTLYGDVIQEDNVK